LAKLSKAEFQPWHQKSRRGYHSKSRRKQVGPKGNQGIPSDQTRTLGRFENLSVKSRETAGDEDRSTIGLEGREASSR